METKTMKEFVDNGFGFPVHLRNVLMVKVRGEWTPKINYNHLARVLLHALGHKSSRLTGVEIKFIRNHFEMTLQDFAKRFSVTHVAVIKWEKSKNQATTMTWSTEKDIRLFILTKLGAKAVLIAKLYADLESIPSARPKPLDLDVGNLAA